MVLGRIPGIWSNIRPNIYQKAGQRPDTVYIKRVYLDPFVEGRAKKKGEKSVKRSAGRRAGPGRTPTVRSSSITLPGSQ